VAMSVLLPGLINYKTRLSQAATKILVISRTSTAKIDLEQSMTRSNQAKEVVLNSLKLEK